MKIVKTIRLKKGIVEALDQTQLPNKKSILKIKSTSQMIAAIKRLSLRGAPLIGVSGAYGCVLAAQEIKTNNLEKFLEKFLVKAQRVASARPTAVNLDWAVRRIVKKVFVEALSVKAARQIILQEAVDIHKEDRKLCEQIGKNGASLIKRGDSILTYCNAGALATGGMGTALAPMYTAWQKGIKFHVYVPETRPLLQGARLTAWELSEAGIPHTLIGDGMIGTLMASGKINKVITGADRIAKNGDTANKIGTYSAAVLADYHKIPFYIAAPFSTFDFKCKTGQNIPIEERDAAEVKGYRGKLWAPKKSNVFNPSFDVTPNKLIAGFITDKGLLKRPYRECFKKINKD